MLKAAIVLAFMVAIVASAPNGIFPAAALEQAEALAELYFCKYGKELQEKKQ